MKAVKARQSFFIKLLMSFLLVGVLPVITLGIFATVFTYSLPIKKLEKESLDMANKSLQSLDAVLDDYKAAVANFAGDDLVKDILSSKTISKYDNNVLYQKMFMLLHGKVNDSDMYLIKDDGELIISAVPDNTEYSRKNMDWGVFRRLNGTEEPVVYPNRYISIYGRSISMCVGKRIIMEGKTLGYVILDIPRSTVEKALAAGSNILDMNYMIIDENFYIMYDEIMEDQELNFLLLDYRDSLLDRKEDTRIVDFNGKAGLLSSLNAGKNGLILLAEMPVETILQNNSYIVVITSIMLAVSIVLCCIITIIMTRRISKPIKKIVHAMEKVEKGDINTRVEIKGDDEIGYMARRFNEMVESLNDLFQKNMEKQDRLRLAEIKSLQSQINPHFLYNTLDSIKWLAKLNGVEEISEIVSKLGNLLKNSINNYDDLATVEETMFLIDSYLSIQKIRFDGKFEVEADIDESIMKCLVPKLMLQPIVENAIVHGIENKIGKSVVKIQGKRENGCIVFEVEDDGVGIGKEDLRKLRNSVVRENAAENIALSNIHNRIKLYYGEKYGLEIFSEKGKGTRVRLTMPVTDGCSPGEEENDTRRDSRR